MMEIYIEKVLERDMDFLIMREFMDNRDFAGLFLSQIGISDYVITGIAHSVMDNEFGESDVIVYLTVGDKRIAIMIEDKIDALQQEQQAHRYVVRGKKMVANGEADEFHVFMVAPKAYLESVREYDNKVSYEQMLSVIDNGLHRALIQRAIDEQKSGYIPIRHEGVTNFWSDLYELVDTKYPNLATKINHSSKDRGANAKWAVFSTCDKRMVVKFKSNIGVVDLELTGFGERHFNVRDYIEGRFPGHGLEVTKTGKSVSLRLYVDKVDFKKEFLPQRDAIIKALESVNRLEEVAGKIRIDEIPLKGVQVKS